MDRDVIRAIRNNHALQDGYTNLLEQTRELMFSQRENDVDGWEGMEYEHRAIEEALILFLLRLREESFEWKRVWKEQWLEATGPRTERIECLD